MGPFKKGSSMSHFVIFSPNPSVLYHLLKIYKLWKAREEVLLYKYLLDHVTLHKKNKTKKVKIAAFEKIGPVIFTYRHLCTNKSCW